jgi:hypothetical protein
MAKADPETARRIRNEVAELQEKTIRSHYLTFTSNDPNRHREHDEWVEEHTPEQDLLDEAKRFVRGVRKKPK